MLKTYESYKGFKDRKEYVAKILKQHGFHQGNDGRWINTTSSQKDCDFTNRLMVENGRLTFNFGDKTYGSLSINSLNLTTLEGCPDIVEGTFSCSFNDLKDLKGGPKMTRGSYYCTHNQDLTSLEGAPKIVDGYFLAHSCKKLNTAYGIPKKFEWESDCLEQTAIPQIEREFVEYVSHNAPREKMLYYEELFAYTMRKDKSQITKIHWPDEFVKSKDGFEELMKSTKGINKYDL